MSQSTPWLAVRQSLSKKQVTTLTILSFFLPILLWSLVSYVPFLWHPKVEIVEPGSVTWLKPGMLVDGDVFAEQERLATEQESALPEGLKANPIYLPAPHEVAIAFYAAFTAEPERSSEQWLHESLWHSITIIFWGFVLSSLVGVPIGILCGTYAAVSKLNEPFVEFFRYLPAPAFGALAVAILGIHDGPKIAIIFIGTFFLGHGNGHGRINPRVVLH